MLAWCLTPVPTSDAQLLELKPQLVHEGQDHVSLLHLGGMPWARIGELVGHDDLVTTPRTYTHVVADEREIDYSQLS
jgi:hypothetical protein